MKRPRLISSLILTAWVLIASQKAMALDSYRYLHVNLESLWVIFLFLLPIVLSPLILLVVLYWRFSLRRQGDEQDAHTGNVGESSEIK